MKATKAQRICFILQQAGGSLTRLEIMERVHQMEGHDMATFSPHSNNCYFLPAPAASYRSNWSVVVKGLVYVDGKVGNRLTYALTDDGQMLATLYASTGLAGQWRG